MDLNRRDFLKGSVTVGGAAALAGLFGCSAPSASSKSAGVPDSWDYEADVVVVGYGGAGCAAAIEAQRAGASVIIIEKQPENAHYCSTKMSGGIFMFAKDVDKAVTYLDACSGPSTPSSVNRVWAETSSTLKDWLNGIGHTDDFYLEKEVYPRGEHDIENREAVAACSIVPTHDAHPLFELLTDAIDEAGNAQILWESPATGLVRRSSEEAPGMQEVLGVEIDQGGKTAYVKANKGVVLSCGGYEYDEDLKQDLPTLPMYFYGNPGNTGDGIRLATSAGAALWHMSKVAGRAILCCGGYGYLCLPGQQPFFFVDQDGKRYFNEDIQLTLGHAVYYQMCKFDPMTNRYPYSPSYWIFDERRAQEGPLTATAIGLLGEGFYDWSEDNSKEVEAGWFYKSDTIEGLAEKIGVDPSNLKATLDAWTASSISGVDELGRKADEIIALEPPFYAAPIYPGGTNTCGGPRRNEKAEICDYQGNPIPRLYGAGECGQVVGNLYPLGGGAISDALCFGRIAGENAGNQEPWK